MSTDNVAFPFPVTKEDCGFPMGPRWWFDHDGETGYFVLDIDYENDTPYWICYYKDRSDVGDTPEHAFNRVTEPTDLERIAKECTNRGLSVVTAESCTAGLVSANLTSNPGSSAWFRQGFVTYSNESKIRSLKVHPRTIEDYGVVSREVAREMAFGALEATDADVAVSVTGYADERRTVFVGVSSGVISRYFKLMPEGDRKEIREYTKWFATHALANFLCGKNDYNPDDYPYLVELNGDPIRDIPVKD